MTNGVVIDSFPDSATKYFGTHAIVAIDVIRATTTAVTGVSLGRRIFPVRNTDDAFILAKELQDPLLAGELGGIVPYGFDLTNSPVQVAALSAIPSGKYTDVKRPIILLSSSGTQLIQNAAVGGGAVFIACFRNISAIANYVGGKYSRIALIGAGTHGQFRREDQMCCAWIAEKLIKRGYKPESNNTENIVSHWSNAGPEDVRGGNSSKYLLRTAQTDDLEFIISHFDDVDTAPILINGEFFHASLDINLLVKK
jgi:2-phosphosulfolactate phosphatase